MNYSKGSKTLLSNASATGSGVPWFGGKGMLIAEATWGGGSIKLQVQSKAGTWVDVANSTLSANGTVIVDLPQCEVKCAVTTATAVYADLLHIPE